MGTDHVWRWEIPAGDDAREHVWEILHRLPALVEPGDQIVILLRRRAAVTPSWFGLSCEDDEGEW